MSAVDSRLRGNDEQGSRERTVKSGNDRNARRMTRKVEIMAGDGLGIIR